LAGSIGKAVGALERELDGLLAGRRVAVLDWPNYANAGDHFIWLGQKALLKRRMKLEILHETTIHQVDFAKIGQLPRDCALVCQGGGNFGDLYPSHQQFREAMVAAGRERRIVMMPQSVNYREPARLAAMTRLYATHSDLHVMARDRRGYDALAALPPHVHRYLHIDSALALAPVVAEIVASLGDAAPRGVVRLRRRDGERAATAKSFAGEIDWHAPDDLAELARSAPPPKAFRLAKKYFTSPYDVKSFARLWAAVKVFHGAARIETDRLHAHILAVMLGKPHRLIYDRYGKIEDFSALWTAETGLADVVKPKRGQQPP